MKKFPSIPKQPKFAILRYYEDIIDEVREKYSNPEKNGHKYKSIIKEMFENLKPEKKDKYLNSYQKDRKIWKKKMKIYNQKYRKKINEILGDRPKAPFKAFYYFKKKYNSKIKFENPKLYNYQIMKKLNELYKSKQKKKKLRI